MEKFKKHAIKDLDISFFDELSEKMKNLVTCLSMAGYHGRDIYYDQKYKHNIFLKSFLIKGYHFLNEENDKSEEFANFVNNYNEYLNLFFFHNGVFHDSSLTKHIPSFSKEDFEKYINVYEFKKVNKLYSKEKWDLINNILFNPEFEKSSIDYSKDKDLVKDSYINFYEDGITKSEIEDYMKKTYSDELNGETPQYAFNSYFYKDDQGNIKEQVSFVDGRYSKEIKNMVHWLEKSLPYTENEKQKKSIETLIQFYKTGKPDDFDKHSLAWIEDTESDVYFTNGFIEFYDDPMNTHATYESILAIKDTEKSKRIQLLSDNAQWFEDRLPIDTEFKKKKATGLSATASKVLSTAGDCYPSIPLGICLPNSDWIREKYGSKSVVISNHSGASKDEVELNEFYKNSDYINNLSNHSAIANNLHTDLHEVLGHGSGRSKSDVKNEHLKDYYSIIEEARADLVGLYYIMDEELIKLGFMESLDIAKAGYIDYINNGLIHQLRRVALGSDITQTHMRNRQLVSKWIIDNTTDVIETIVEKVEGKSFSERIYYNVLDFDKLRVAFGVLLKEIQRIKSTGDFDSAEQLVEKYGTEINQKHHENILKRYDIIDYSAYMGYKIPIIFADDNMNISIIKNKSYIESEIEYELKFGNNS
jgi:dipeptidyl-peptidase-3